MHKHMRPSPVDALTRAACVAICILFLLFFLLPIGYVLISSVAYRDAWSLGGYKLLLENSLVLSGLKNSLFIAGVGTLYSLCLELPAAYVLAKKRNRWLASLFFMLGQFGVAILPLYLLLKQLGLLGSPWSLILPCGLSVYYTQLLRVRIMNISAGLEEAAALDGAGTPTYLVRILLPVLGPSAGCIAFFHICNYWSGTLFAQTFITDASKYPLSVVLMELLVKNRSADVLTAGTTSVDSVAAVQMAEFALCVLSSLPLVVIFLFMRKHIRAVRADGNTTL